MLKQKQYHDTFYRSSAFYLLASGLASVANYILYPILSKLLTPAELGDFGAALTIIVQTGSILLAFNIIAIYLTQTEGEKSAVAKLEIVQRKLVRVFAGAALLIILSIPYLKNLLKIEDGMTLVWLGILMVVIIPSVIWTGYLQGQKMLPLIGVYNLLNAIFKVTGAGLMALLGFGASGAVFGVILGFIASMIALKILSPHELPSITSIFKRTIDTYKLLSVRWYILESLAVSIVASGLFALNVLAAKVIFTQHDAGLFIGASTLAGAVYYLIMTFSWVVLPHFSLTDTRHNTKIITKSVGISIICMGVFATIFYLYADQLLRLALGEYYTALGSLLWLMAIFQGLTAIISLMGFSLLVLKQRGALTLCGGALLATLAAIVFSDKSYSGLTGALIIGQVVGIILFIISKVTWMKHEKN